MAPMFVPSKLVLNISEDAFQQFHPEQDQMHVLTRVEAIDEDLGHFGKIEYKIADQNGPFWVDAETGVLSSVGPLDREEK